MSNFPFALRVFLDVVGIVLFVAGLVYLVSRDDKD